MYRIERLCSGLNKLFARSEAWHETSKYDDEISDKNVRFKCSGKLLQKIIGHQDKDLLICVTLERYEKSDKSRYYRTTAIIRISKTLKHEFILRKANHLQESGF